MWHQQNSIFVFHLSAHGDPKEIAHQGNSESEVRGRISIFFSPSHKFTIFSLLKIYENGMRQRNSKRLYTPPSQCTNSQFFQTVGLYEAYYPFIILLYGFGLSTIVAIFEVAQKKFNFIEKLAEMLLLSKKIIK